MEYIVPKHNLLSQVRLNEYKDKIKKRVNELGLASTDFSDDLEFILLVCRLVEYVVNEKGVDKRKLVTDIIKDLYYIDDEKVKKIESHIEFLWSNKRIKKLSYYHLFLAGVNEFFKKR